MTNEQARKLLGGYATNSLTETERKTLFDAALEDQELFDALQQEQALKELLADPASRAEIQRALSQTPDRGAHGAAWWTRSWAWGGLAGALAATVLIVAVIRSGQSRYQYARVGAVVQSAPLSGERAAQPPIKPQPSQTSARRAKAARPAPLTPHSADERKDAETGAGIAPPPAALESPPPPPPQPAPALPQHAQQFRSQQTVQVQNGAAQVGPAQLENSQAVVQAQKQQKEFAAVGGVAGLLSSYRGPLLRYSVLKRDPTGTFSPLASGAALNIGDGFRLTISSGVAGYLSLHQLDASGQWIRLFPQAEQGLLVAPNVSQTVPDSPLIVKEVEQRLRIMLVPAAAQTARSSVTDQVAKAATPLIVDVTISPGKVP